MFKQVWGYWKKFGIWMGNIMSTFILTVFYFTLLAVFAIPFRLFSKLNKAIEGDSNYSIPERQMEALKDFEKEF